MSNEVIKCLKAHRSIRNFSTEEIKKYILDEIILSGTRAASGGNLQQYSFIIINDADKLKALGVPNAPMAIIALADQFRISRWFEVSNVKKIVNYKAHNLYFGIWDALIALHNMVISAESLGLGAYYYGDVTSINVKEIIGNPEYTFPAGMICLGYPNVDSKISDRLPIDAVVHYNTYKKPTDEDIKIWYSQKEEFFQTRNTKERLEQLSQKNIFNLAQTYAKNKYDDDNLNELSEGIKKNIKETKFEL